MKELVLDTIVKYSSTEAYRELVFLSIWNECEQLADDNGNINLIYKDELYFQIDNINKILWVSYDFVYGIFHDKHDMSNNEIDNMIGYMLLERFNLKITEIRQFFIGSIESWVFSSILGLIDPYEADIKWTDGNKTTLSIKYDFTPKLFCENVIINIS